MDHFDPYIEAPYFVVSRKGKSAPGFVSFYKGRLNPYNQLKYFKPRLERRMSKVRGGISAMIKRKPKVDSAAMT
jgi:hypothetical protein